MTSIVAYESRVRALLEGEPEMPAAVTAEQVGWAGSITWFRANVKLLRPDHRRLDPADRLVWEPGDATRCDLWFPPRKIPLEDGSARFLPVLVITAAHSRFITGRMIPTRKTDDLLLATWEWLQQFRSRSSAAALGWRARRHASGLQHIGIGYEHIDTAVRMLIHDLQLDTSRDYQPLGRPPGPPKGRPHQGGRKRQT